MKRILLAILIVYVVIVGFDSCKKKVPLNVRYWKVSGSGFQYPEISDPEFKYPPILNRPNYGICFSGGGTVSASLITGYLKALEELKLMGNFRYISGVSGGTWGSAPYCFLPGDISDDLFLGAKYLPEDLTQDILNRDPQGSMIHAVTNARIIDLTLKNILYTHEAYTRAVGEIFLKPFGIDYDKRYFITNQDAVAKIIARNSQLTPDDFVTLRPDRPFLIMNATFFLPISNPLISRTYQICPFEFTPLYSGLKPREPSTGICDQVIGGFFVESFGFDTTLMEAEGVIASVTPGRNRFALCEPVGTSGEAVEGIAVKWAPFATLPFPQFNYWNLSDPASNGTHKYNFGDGGILEDTGVTALLRRRVECMAVFLTNPFDTENPIDPNDKNEMTERYYGYNQVACLFGQPIYNTQPGHDFGKLITDPYQRTVFDPVQFEELKNQLQTSKKTGGPIFASGTYSVQSNEMFGVEGSWSCRIIWMCVDTCTDFNRRLPSSIGEQIGQPGELQDFPVVKVFYQNKRYVIQLTPVQANMLGNFAYWMVKDKQQDFLDLFLTYK